MRIFFSIFCFGLLIHDPLAAQTKRYVSLTGNDLNAGTIIAPWRTIQKAANSAQAGDSVFVRGGTYTEKIIMGVSGTAGNFITFINYPDEKVVVDGGSTNTGTTLLAINGKNYIRIAGMEWKNAKGPFSQGIFISNGSSHIEILGNKVSAIDYSTSPGIPGPGDNSSPLLVYGNNASIACNNILIRKNEIFNCRTGYSEALTFTGNVDGFIADSNYIHNISNIGIDIAGGWNVSSNPANDFSRNGIVSNNIVDSCVSPIGSTGCIYVDGGKSTVIYGNRSSRCHRGFAINCENPGKIADRILVRDNIAFSNLEAGFTLGNDLYPAAGTVTNCQLLNNTSYNNFKLDNNSGFCEIAIYHNTGCRIENNIIFPTNASKKALIFAGPASSADTLNYNLYFSTTGDLSFFNYNNYYGSLASFKAGTAYEANSVFGNPAFVDTTLFNFRIGPSSAGIDKGNPLYSPTASVKDYYGGLRKNGIAVDAGADEADIVTAIGLPGYANNKSLEVYPNPARQWINIRINDRAIKTLKLWGVSGQGIKEFPVTGTTMRLPINELSKGVWLITGFDKQNKPLALRKFILQ